MKRPTAASTSFLLLMAVIAGSIGFSAVAGSKSGPLPFVPDPAGAPGVLVEGETWIFDGVDLTIRLTRVGDSARQAFIQERTGFNIDPFATRPDRPSGFVTFLVELENHGQGSFSLNPLNCWLFDGNIPGYPLDLPTIQSSYTMLEREMPPAYNSVGRALLDGETVVVPGGSASGLLVYRPLKPKSKRFRVELQITDPAGGVNRFVATYRRAKKK